MALSRTRLAISIALIGVLLATTACGCSGSLARLRALMGRAPEPTVTLYPTATPNLTPLPGDAFTVEITADELNEALANAEMLQQGGFAVEDIRVAISAQEISASFRASHADLGVALGLRAHGVPVVVDEQAYFQVTSVEIDDSVTGFTRLMAQAAIDQMLADYGTASGIPIPVEGVSVDGVEMAEGKLIVTGRQQ
jgi:hypothetical protein